MACETVDTQPDDADTLGISDVTRIALRRNFEDGAVVIHREAKPSTMGNADEAVGMVSSRRDVSGAASLLDAILYDDVSSPKHTSLDRALTQSREQCSEADDR